MCVCRHVGMKVCILFLQCVCCLCVASTIAVVVWLH